MSNLTDFFQYLEETVGSAIYVLGGQTQVVWRGNVYKTEERKTCYGSLDSWLKNKAKQSTGNCDIILDTYAKVMRNHKADDVIRIVDCSGLGMNFLQNMRKIYSSDMTANGMLGKCKRIPASELKPGDWVFQTYKSGEKKGRAHHIGYVVDKDLNVIESKGKAYGVVKNPFSSDYWNCYGRPLIFKDEIESEPDPKPQYCFTRVIKKTSPLMKGEDVRNLQILLNIAIDAQLATDGVCGDKTVKAIKAYQKEKGLTVDGKAGKKTIEALGGIFIQVN